MIDRVLQTIPSENFIPNLNVELSLRLKFHHQLFYLGDCLIAPYLLFSSYFLQEIPIKNPVYLMLGASFGSAAKGTGLKALEFALSICDSVDMYGFTVDPGYKEWYEICCYK